MKTLGIETSSSLFSLAVCDDKDIIFEVRKNRLADPTSKDAHFFSEAKQMIDHQGIESIKALVVSIGPGMFTSLRVGLSFAKALAISHNIPVYAINTLDIIGKSFEFIERPVLATLNAYQNEIYAADYLKGERKSGYLLLQAQEIVNLITDDMLIVGSGIRVLKNIRPAFDAIKPGLYPDEAYQPSASEAIRAAYARIQQDRYDEVDQLEPFYIKKTDAEQYYNKKNAHR